jgi:hypothetical protein
MKKIAQLTLIIGLTNAATSYPMGEWLHEKKQNFLEWRGERQINRDYTRMVVIPVTKLIQEEAKNTPRNIDQLLPKWLCQELDKLTPTKRPEILKELYLEKADQILNEISQDPDAFFHQNRDYQHKTYSDLEIVLRRDLYEKIETKVSDMEKELREKYPDTKLNLNIVYNTSLNKMIERENWKERKIYKDYVRMVVIPATELIQETAKNTPRSKDAIEKFFSDEWLPEEGVDMMLNKISQDPDAFFHQDNLYRGYLETLIRQTLKREIETKLSDLGKKFLEKHPNLPDPYYFHIPSLNEVRKHEQRRRQLQEPAYFEYIIARGWRG